MKYNKVKAVDIHIFLIPTIIISLVFVLLGVFISNQINDYYSDLMRIESQKLAVNTSNTLAKSNSAFEIINEFMAEKIQSATETIVNYDGIISQDRLFNFAKTLNVDVIYYYNPSGVIIASNSGEYLGWVGDTNHPVEKFRQSQLSVLVEDIRRDTESNIYYKYGYARSENGYFVQVGIYAQDVYQYLSEFDEQSLIDELKQDENIREISIIDKRFNVIASSNKSNVGQSVAQSRFINSEQGKLYQSDQGEVYEAFAPVNINSVNVGFLSIQYNLNKTKALINDMTNFGIMLIISFYLIVLVLIYNSYQKNRKLIQLAFYDNLTTLPNDDYLKYYINENFKKDNSINALVLLNCINFKRINLSYGYKEGDYILQKIAQKLRLLDRNTFTVFKFNADRFIILLENLPLNSSISTYIDTITTIINQYEFKPEIEIKMGIVEITQDDIEVDDILKNASIALNSITHSSYATYDIRMIQKIQREDLIEQELRRAVQQRDKNSIYFQYQPIFDLSTHKIICFEALARLNISEYGLVPPIEFIEIAEKKQLIVPMGEYLLNEACLLIKHISQLGYDQLKIAVNVSGIQLMQDEFIYIIERLLKKHHVNPMQLELEITESVFMHDFESINKKLSHLRDLGISISMDDFGTGFSSFYRLKEAYLDILKIDRYFVKNIDSSEDDKLISKDIISIGHKYGLKCVAEGIENAYQLENLTRDKCDYGQGYYLSYPIDEDEVLALIRKHND